MPFALLVIDFALFLALVESIILDLMRTFSYEVFGAPTIVACSLLLIGESSLHKFAALFLEALLKPLDKESNIIDFFILFTITFIFT